MSELLDDPYAGLIGDTTPVSGLDSPEAEFRCIVCGKPLVYGGRGRHPKYCDDDKPGVSKVSTSPRRSGKGDVETALAAMDMLYSGMSMLLLAVDVEAATEFANRIPQAQAKNRMAFEGDAGLVKAVCKGTGKAGKGVFISSQIMLMAPVAKVVVTKASTRKPKTVATPMPSTPTNVTPMDTLRRSPDPTLVDPIDANIAASKRRS